MVLQSDYSPCPERPVRPDAGLPVVHVAAAALVDGDGRVLIQQRKEGKAMAGLWEFPGGKIEPAEIPEGALHRELYEELGIDVCVSCMMPFSFASHSYDSFHLVMPLFVIRNWDGVPRPLAAAALKWVRAPRLGDFPMPEADRPLVAMLQDYL